MSQEYKILSVSATTNGGITETETTYVSTTAVTLTFSAVTMDTISATTISAISYGNLPIDIYMTGGTYSNGTATFTNNTGGTFNINGFFTGSTDIDITGGTFSTANRSITFTNATGGTFTVDNITDNLVTGGTYNSGTGIATFTNSTGGTFTVTGFSSSAIFNGGTVTGATSFTGGLSANTISATTYQLTGTSNSILYVTGNTIGQDNLNLSWNPLTKRLFVANNNSSSFATAQTGTLIHVVSNGATNGRISLDTYAASNTFGAVFQGRKARGTNAAPTAAIKDDTLALIGGDGYGTTNFHGSSVGAFLVKTEQTFTDTSAPTYLALFTSPSGSTSAVERWRVGSNGSLTNSLTASTFNLFVTGTSVANSLSASTITASTINITGSTSGQEFNLYRYSADNQAGGILSYKARGTSGAPSAILSGDTFAVMGGRGYDGTGFTSTSKANISFITSENWSSTRQGNYISFNTTASGSTTRSEVAKLDTNGLNVYNGITGCTITATTYQITGNTSNILFVKNGQINQNTNRFKWDDGNFGLLIASSGITTGATYQLQSPVFVKLDSNDFYHYNIQNMSTGSSASSEYVLTANNGDRDNKFFAVGINNSGFADPTYSLKTPNSGYLLMNGGNLFIGTQTAHDIVFHTSGTTPTKELVRMKPSGSIIIGGSSGTTDNGQELQISGNTYVTGGITGNTIVLNSSSGFKMGSSTTSGFVLTADANGNGTWQQTSATGATGTPATSAQTNDGTSNTLMVTPLGLQGSKYLTQDGSKTYMTVTGTNSYSGDTSPSLTAVTTGTTLHAIFLNANTTSGVTLNIPSIGAKSIKKNGVELDSGDILSNNVLTLFYNGTNWDIIGYNGTLRSLDWVDFPARVTSTVAGSAPTITLSTNTRIIRTLTRTAGTNQNTIFYWMFYIPDDFIAFPTNAFRVESSRNSVNSTLTVTFGSGGVADSTMNALSVVATGTGDVFETKFATPSSTYRPGDLVLAVLDMATTTNNNNVIRLGMAGLSYIAR